MKIKIYLFFALVVVLSNSCRIFKPDNKAYGPGYDYNLFNNTPIFDLANAVKNEDIKQIDRILTNPATQINFHEPKYGNTLLTIAIATHKDKAIKRLLEKGANIEIRTYADSMTPLMIACDDFIDDCNTKRLKMLISFHADVNGVKSIDRIENGSHRFIKRSVLMIASGHNCLEKIKVLIDNGADVNMYTYYDGYGAITEALVHHNLEIAKYFIIERQAKIPKYCYIRNKDASDEQRLTITDMLQEDQFEPGTKNYQLRAEIITYLKDNGLK